VPWADRGKNVSRGWINIPCPFCGDDPSAHMGIHEDTGRYSCLRDPEHHGGDPVRLVQKLVPPGPAARRVAVALIEDWRTVTVAERETPEPSGLRWADFAPAWHAQVYVDYLGGRGFNDPVRTIQRFDLRRAPAGRWAARLLLPLYGADGTVRGWTGRAVRAGAEPPYLAEGDSTLLAGVLSGTALVVVEGPVDALKINSALAGSLSDISAVALAGKALTYGRLNAIADRRPRHVLVCLDRDVKPVTAWQIAGQLGAACRVLVPEVNIKMLGLPEGYGDPGELPEDAVVPWLLDR